MVTTHSQVHDSEYAKRVSDLRANDFTRTKGLVYLDHAGTTLYSDSQLQCIFKDLAANTYGNPHSQNGAGSSTSEKVERVREQILHFFNTSSKHYQVIFTSGCTQSLRNVGEWFNWSSNSTYLYTDNAHNSLLGVREYAVKSGGKFSAFPTSALLSESESGGSETLETILCTNTKPQEKDGAINLLAYSAQCNFSGVKYPLHHASYIHKHHPTWRVLIDAASFVGTSQLDLSRFEPDFVAFSFHKMIGYPTGLGALLVRNSALQDLNKTYFGGGTVLAALADEHYHIKRTGVAGFEDGTLPFHSILAIPYGLSMITSLGMENITTHVQHLTRKIAHSLANLRHNNGKPVVVLYGHHLREDFSNTQGGIVTFNVLNSTGEYVGYNEVEKLASLNSIHVRTGCFCNPGACQQFLSITSEAVKENLAEGHVCWDDKAVINGRPTGAVRVSFGYMSTIEDVNIFVEFMKANFTSPIYNTNGESHEIHAEDMKITSLYVYPVKSCAPYVVQEEWEICTEGLKYDREWAIVDAGGKYVNQKRITELCLIKPTIDLISNVMTLSCSQKTKRVITISLETHPDDVITTRICGDDCVALAYGEEVSEWLRECTGVCGLSLVRKSPDHSRISKLAGTDEISFANESAFLLIGLESVQDLYSRIASSDGVASFNSGGGALSFRPNIVFSGGAPYIEDELTKFSIGTFTFQSLGPCNRCRMITIDQETGKEGNEPLKTLSTYRRAKGGRITFGVHLAINIPQTDETSILRIGSIITPNITTPENK